LGRFSEAEVWIRHFEETITGKTARYILFCKVRAYSAWLKFDFPTAIDWASKGVDLKSSSNLDTAADCAHTLALAKRDSGDVETALRYFLKGEKLETVLDPDEFVASRGGEFYGNIGRCLQFNKRFDEALICLRKSAKILETTETDDAIMNRAWAASWIG